MERVPVVALLVALLVAGGVGAATTASAHPVNYLSADAQLSADGTVYVEAAFPESDGWLALYGDNGSGTGEPLGHANLTRAGVTLIDVPVRLDRAAWANTTGARTVRPVLHGDDGDGRFEPDEDPELLLFGSLATVNFTVERADRPAHVLAEGDARQRVDAPRLRVRRAALPDDGFLVVHDATDDGDGRLSLGGDVVGVRALDAGTHRNVTVAVDEAFYDSQPTRFAVVVAAYRDDGDGRFGDGDRPVRAGERPVATRLELGKATGNATASDEGSLVTTSTPAPSPTTPATTGRATATQPPATAAQSPTTSGTGGGFGPGVALGAAAATAGLLAWRLR